MSAPVLAEGNFSAYEFGQYPFSVKVKILGGLHKLRGNKMPYFSLTYEVTKAGRKSILERGVGPDIILQHWPQFASLAALHLSYIDGTPLHAVANGWYFLSGAVPGHFGELSYCEPDKAIARLAKHLRVTEAAARSICQVCVMSDDPVMSFREMLIEMAPRWKQEADDAIRNFNLQIYGDTDE